MWCNGKPVDGQIFGTAGMQFDKKQNKTVYDYMFGPAGICHVMENVDDYVLDLAGMSCNGKRVDDQMLGLAGVWCDRNQGFTCHRYADVKKPNVR